MPVLLEERAAEPLARSEARRGRPPVSPDLFAALPSVRARPRRSVLGLGASLAAHAVVAAALVLGAVFWPRPLPKAPDYLRVLLYDYDPSMRPPPPPPPPPPLPLGHGPLARRAPPERVASEGRSAKPVLVAPAEPAPESAQPSQGGAAKDQGGSPTGSELGVPEGMEEGVEGGVLGGEPGGVLGGVVGGVPGGIGEGPVADYDRPPRLLRMTKPAYPDEAFIKKVEGTVVLEILIDVSGRVVRVRVLRSIPLLDAAAIAAVRQWAFVPAIKGGRPVPTIARAPISFTLY